MAGAAAFPLTCERFLVGRRDFFPLVFRRRARPSQLTLSWTATTKAPSAAAPTAAASSSRELGPCAGRALRFFLYRLRVYFRVLCSIISRAPPLCVPRSRTSAPLASTHRHLHSSRPFVGRRRCEEIRVYAGTRPRQLVSRRGRRSALTQATSTDLAFSRFSAEKPA